MRHNQPARQPASTTPLFSTPSTSSLARPVIVAGLVIAVLAALCRLGPLAPATQVADTLAIGCGLLLSALGAAHALAAHIVAKRASRDASAQSASRAAV